MKFTDSQSQAIQSNSKKILVVAGAGSGKTLTLVERICRQISDGIDPRNILALTFSNKAATEMKNRIVKKLGTKASKIWVKTFHSFGLSIIRMYGEEIGIPKKVDIIDSSSKSLFVKEYLDNNNLTYLPEETFNTISSIKNQIIDCPDVFKDLYDEYNKYLKDNNLIDFEDMVSISLDVFKNSERAIKQVRNRFKHILVDEYQDTNYIQNKLVEIISDGNNIFFVGDDDQCIYEWRGSRPEYFRNLNNSGDFEVIYLRENFRSESSIVSMANVIINRNKNRLNKEMLPTINSNDKPEIKTFLNNVQEALFIVKEIKKELLTGVKKNEIAVLGRNIAQLDRIKYFLDMEGIEYSTIIDIHKHQFGFIKFLKNVKNLKFRSNFSAAINFPNRILDRFAYEDILEENSIISNEPYDIINEIYNKNIEFEYENPFRERYELILKISEDELSPLEIVYEYYNILQNVDKEEANDSNKNLLVELQDIKALTETFIFDNDKINLTEYIDYLQCMFEYSNENIQTNVEGINVLTCHKSKGLEYDIVFIPGLQIGNFPNDYFVTTEQEIEQERRLLYVSLTRAKKKLYITRFDNRQSIYPFEFNKDGFISELENIKYNMNNEISNIVVEEQELDEIDKEEMYKKQ